jgi:alpha-L-arabinofuranosidase
MKLLSNTRITTTLPVISDTGFISSAGCVYWVAGYSNETSEHIAKIAVYNTTDSANVSFSLSFPSKTVTKANLTFLSADDPYAYNTFSGENVVITINIELDSTDNYFAFELPQWSVAVLTSTS